jgi:hypothetical protein
VTEPVTQTEGEITPTATAQIQNTANITITVNDSSGSSDNKTIPITISSQADNTGSIADQYNTNGRSGIQVSELLDAVADFRNNKISPTELLDVIDAFRK